MPTKVPYSPVKAGKARADAADTWGSLDRAQARAAALPKPFALGGVGIEFCPLADGRSLAGIDLDTCRDPATGGIEGWARDIIDRLATYTEVSPSGSGVKLFFLFVTADHERIRKALGTNSSGDLKYSASWTRRTGANHPPAVEVHTGNRYFATTFDALSDSTDELREISTADLLRLIELDGPAFVGRHQSTQHPSNTHARGRARKRRHRPSHCCQAPRGYKSASTPAADCSPSYWPAGRATGPGCATNPAAAWRSPWRQRCARPGLTRPTPSPRCACTPIPRRG